MCPQLLLIFCHIASKVMPELYTEKLLKVQVTLKLLPSAEHDKPYFCAGMLLRPCIFVKVQECCYVFLKT